MDKHLLELSQAEYLRQLNNYLTENKKKTIPTDIDIEEIILKYLEEKNE